MTMAMKSVVHSLAYGFDFLCEQVADVAPAEMVNPPGYRITQLGSSVT